MDGDAFFVAVTALFGVGSVLFHWRQSRRIAAVLEDPETDLERAARLRPPAHLDMLSTFALLSGLREDLRNADAYLESAQAVLRERTFVAWLDRFRIEPDTGPGGAQQEEMNRLFHDLMEADTFLVDARHRLRLLGGRGDLAVPLRQGGIEAITLDWVVDNPLADFATYRRLKALGPELAKLRAAVVGLLEQLDGHEAR